MEIFVLRHGQAEAFAARDSDRQLTAHGHHEVTTIVSGALDALASVQMMWVSPYVRAQQTADITQQLISGFPDSALGERQVTDLLVPEADPNQLCEQLQALDVPSILLVSHQPLVGTLVNGLCGLAPGRYSMGTAALASIETDIVAADLGELRWLRQPGMES